MKSHEEHDLDLDNQNKHNSMTDSEKRLDKVFIMQNGMVAVFDVSGDQMNTLQGRWIDKAKDIYRVADSGTIWYDYRSVLT